MARTLDFKGSSNLKSAKLGDDGILEVAFQNGSTHRFGNVTSALMDDWSVAESAGRWFHNRIRSRPKDYPHLGEIGGVPGAVAPLVEAEVVVDAGQPPAALPARPVLSPPSPAIAQPAPVPPQPVQQSGTRPTRLGARVFAPWRDRRK